MIEKLKNIKLLAMDVDGTLTDGSMIFLDGHQLKVFNVLDGLGIRLAMNYGLKIAWVTGNVTPAVADRAKTIGVEEVYQGSRFKSNSINEIAKNNNILKSEIAYIGDDLNDIPALEVVGVAFAVKNAVEEVKLAADYVTEKEGGKGAVREVIELILKSQSKWNDAVMCFLKELEKEDSGEKGPEAVA